MTEENTIRLLTGLVCFLSGALGAAGLTFATVITTKTKTAALEHWRDLHIEETRMQFAQISQHEGRFQVLGEWQNSMLSSISRIELELRGIKETELRSMRDAIFALKGSD